MKRTISLSLFITSGFLAGCSAGDDAAHIEKRGPAVAATTNTTRQAVAESSSSSITTLPAPAAPFSPSSNESSSNAPQAKSDTSASKEGPSFNEMMDYSILLSMVGVFTSSMNAVIDDAKPASSNSVSGASATKPGAQEKTGKTSSVQSVLCQPKGTGTDIQAALNAAIARSLEDQKKQVISLKPAPASAEPTKPAELQQPPQSRRPAPSTGSGTSSGGDKNMLTDKAKEIMEKFKKTFAKT